MTKNWYNAIEDLLHKDEVIQKSYRIEFNNDEGYLSLTDKRIIFIKVEGFLTKTYKKILDLSYEDISTIIHETSHKFCLEDIVGQRYNFVTSGIPATIIEKSMEYYRLHPYEIPDDKIGLSLVGIGVDSKETGKGGERAE
jgi:hypothetical protein